MTIKHLPVEVIPDCVSPEFKSVEQPFNAEYPHILQVGTNKNKNIERVAAALEGLACRFIIVGKLTVSQRACLEKYKIEFENHVGISRNEILSLYQRADIVMFASLYEGFGLPILEANAIGRPVITSQLYSMPEVGGDGACYVNPLNIDEIRAAVERIIHDDEYRKQLVNNGFHNVERFSPKAVAEQYASLYRKIGTVI